MARHRNMAIRFGRHLLRAARTGSLRCTAGRPTEPASFYQFGKRYDPLANVHPAAKFRLCVMSVTLNAEVNSARWRPRYGPLRGASASFTPAKAQLGNATVGAAEPPAEFAVDVLHHDHIGVDVGLVVRVEVSGRELVQYGCGSPRRRWLTGSAFRSASFRRRNRRGRDPSSGSSARNRRACSPRDRPSERRTSSAPVRLRRRSWRRRRSCARPASRPGDRGLRRRGHRRKAWRAKMLSDRAS